jgi:HK97 gp10 family phage protein
MQFELTFTGLNELIERAEAAGANLQPLMSAALTKSTTELQKAARIEAPHDTGALQQSILSLITYPIGTVTVGSKYGIFVEQGTRPHLISPKTKKALFWAGAAYPVKAVNHPGTKANPFFQRAIESSMEYIRDVYLQVANSITRQLGGK